MEMTLAGLRAVVTGGGGGLGRAIAERFHQLGARIHVCDLVETGLEELRRTRPEIGTVVADVGDPEDVDRVFSLAAGAMGGLDVLVNNVGIAGPTAGAEEVSPEDWDQVLRVNLSGQFYCARQAIPMLKEAGGGAIVNISSTSARTGLPYRLPYAVSKCGVLGLTETLARELGPANIRVNSILPGWINNERAQRVVDAKAKELGITAEAYRADLVEFVSMRTLIEANEIAEMVAFLCSRAGRHISGQAIGVCGNVEYER